VDVTGADVVQFNDCTVTALGGGLWLSFAGVFATDTRFIGARFTGIGALSAIGFVWLNCAWQPGAGFPAAATIFGMSGTVVNSFYNCTFDAEADEWFLFRRGANSPIVSLHGCTLSVENTGGATCTMFGPGATLGVNLRGVTVTRTGAGVVDFGLGTPNPFTGLSWHGTDPDDALLPSGSWHNVAGAIVEVP
jgi:hypothetical protein